MKWHLAHTTWFFETFILKPHLSGYSEFDPEFAFLFNSYYVSAGKRHTRNLRGLITRPDLAQVYAYRTYVDEHMGRLLEQNCSDAEQLTELGINHEQQHQELMLTDLKYLFWHNPLLPAYDQQLRLQRQVGSDAPMVDISEGIYEIGHAGAGFAYDNESPKHRVFLSEAKLCSEVASNQLMLDFIENGGYQNPLLWHDAGYAWVQQSQQTCPLYWYEQDDGARLSYHLSGAEPIDPTGVLTHINAFEAHALAEFSGMRLPTEFEHEVAASKLAVGKCWEWTSSSYLPYPGFKAAEGALGEYNGKFMINQSVLRGFSAATSPGHNRSTYRNFFPTDASWQFTGLRLAAR
jgi:ergothioneine biosynthesis protein EgtB